MDPLTLHGPRGPLLLAPRACRWEQINRKISKTEGEIELLIRWTLEKPVTKKDIKVVFKPRFLQVTVAGVDLIKGPTFGPTYPDEGTWCIIEGGKELQVQLSLSTDTKWTSLLEHR